MSDLRKAAEMALEALETLWDILDDIDTTSDIAKENDAWYRKRVEFLQKKRWDTTITTDGYKLKGGPVYALRTALAQPSDSVEQEPVKIWVKRNGEFIEATKEEFMGTLPKRERSEPREWVGLTDEEFKHFSFHAPWEIVQEIEAKLKEKNT